MSCPDWRRLASAGDEILREGSLERRRLLAHLEGCAGCASKALTVDPTLAVSRLPAPAASRAEIEAIKSSVESLRHLREVEAAVRPRPRRRVATRLAAVAVFAAGIFFVAEDTHDRRERETAAPSLGLAAGAEEDYRLFGSLPLVEPVDSSPAPLAPPIQDELAPVSPEDEPVAVDDPDAGDGPDESDEPEPETVRLPLHTGH